MHSGGPGFLLVDDPSENTSAFGNNEDHFKYMGDVHIIRTSESEKLVTVEKVRYYDYY